MTHRQAVLANVAERLSLVQHIGMFEPNLIGGSTVAYGWQYDSAANVLSTMPATPKHIGRTPRAGRLLSGYCETARRAFDRDGNLTFRYGFRFT
jgi:hypothetical protein